MSSDPTQQGKPLGVVRPLTAICREIRIAPALIQEGCINDVGQDTRSAQSPYPQGHSPRPKNGPDITNQRLPLYARFDGRQPRQDQTYIDARLNQGLRQGPQYICQSPCFDERKNLRRRMKNLHSVTFASISAVTSVMPLALR